MANPWFFDDVVHDSDQAADAADGLARAAGSLSDALQLLEHDIPDIVEDWAGPARWTFDADMPGILEAGHQLLATLVSGVSAVAYYDELAANEVTRRQALREQWQADQNSDIATDGVIGGAAGASEGS